MRNIYLCGFMGCGKSYMGKKLAEKLGCTLVDLDAYIEEKEGKTIPEIFAEFSERFCSFAILGKRTAPIDEFILLTIKLGNCLPLSKYARSCAEYILPIINALSS